VKKISERFDTMNSKRTKIIVDVLMTIFIVLSFVRWSGTGGAVYHIVVGSACTLFFSAHIFIHRNWLKATTKSFVAGKLGKALMGKYIVDVLLLVVWGICIITGFIALAPFFTGAGEASVWAAIHGITARAGAVLILVHVVQHIPQIKAYVGIKKRAKNAG